MSLYTIKKVPIEEYSKLVLFLDEHWKKGHALVKSRELLDFQHLDKKNKCYNFIVAENNETHEYDALVGYIPTSQYDPSLEPQGDYWGAIWKIREDIKNNELSTAGFYIWKSIFKLPSFHSYSAIGISSVAKQIYEASRMHVSCLNHYYILNDSISDFKIAANVESLTNTRDLVRDASYSLNWIDSTSLLSLSVTSYYRPYKSIQYIISRYVKHPIYKYRFLGLYHKKQLVSIWTVRKLRINDSNILRIIDVLGRFEGNLYLQIQEILDREQAEYIDLMNYGIDVDVIKRMGFSLLDWEGKLVIPNYMEPFEQRNVKIDIAYKGEENYVAFKGDSDQDRPNII